ncbi:fam11a b protein [Anaeramoeba ignava]|uniref:Fam11a b protein n=1 Tax=Anaeramoeba ignava TaxID=1746090 RepID=A0A9Q0LFF3_ANAIG|nr:fam11a b protein [Anaeramoeba ignava]
MVNIRKLVYAYLGVFLIIFASVIGTRLDESYKANWMVVLIPFFIFDLFSCFFFALASISSDGGSSYDFIARIGILILVVIVEIPIIVFQILVGLQAQGYLDTSWIAIFSPVFLIQIALLILSFFKKNKLDFTIF